MCDIMTNKFSPVAANGGIDSIEHGVGKIGDTNSVLVDYSVEEFMASVQQVPQDAWVGTHCWPGKLPLESFRRVIVITTSTYRSQIYRWLRAYHHYFQPQWQDLSGMELTDKTRETAKNYVTAFDPVYDVRVENLEFADVVEQTAEFKHVTKNCEIQPHMQRWIQLNEFLYSNDLWNNPLVQEFSRAQHEIHLQRYYRYE